MSSAATIVGLLEGGRRQPDRYAALEVGTVITAFVVGLAFPIGPLALLIGLKAPLVGIGLVCLWALGGVATLIPSWSAPLASRLVGLRDCTPREYERLSPLVADVSRRAGLDASRTFNLRTWPCPPGCLHPPFFINACAVGLDVIALSADAIEQLDKDEIRALVAHEVGHHLGYQPAARMLACYYLFIFDGTLGRLGSIGRRAGMLLGWPVRIAIALSSKPAELHCDEVAARLGYGRPLRRLLARFGPNDPTGLRDAILGTHPALADRLHRIDSVLQGG